MDSVELTVDRVQASLLMSTFAVVGLIALFGIFSHFCERSSI
jgi:hypothetical protein